MSFNLSFGYDPSSSGGSGGSFETAAPGIYHARVGRIIQLGSHPEATPKGDTITRMKLRIGFELVNSLSDTNIKSGDGRRLYEFVTFTLSLADKANLTKLCEAVFGAAAVKEAAMSGAAGFDSLMSQLPGKPVTLVVSEGKQKSDGTLFTQIASYSKAPETIPQLEGEPVCFVFRPWDGDAFTHNLTRWERSKIAASLEWPAICASHYPGETPAQVSMRLQEEAKAAFKASTGADGDAAAPVSKPSVSAAPARQQKPAPASKKLPPIELDDEIPF